MIKHHQSTTRLPLKNLSFFLAGFAVFSGIRASAAQSIGNDRYAISVEAVDGSFTLTSKPGEKKFLTGGKLSGTGGTVKEIELTDKTFGRGKGLQISYPNGNKETVALYPNLPFVLFNSSFHNGGAEPVTLNHVQTASGVVDLGLPAAGSTPTTPAGAMPGLLFLPSRNNSECDLTLDIDMQ